MIIKNVFFYPNNIFVKFVTKTKMKRVRLPWVMPHPLQKTLFRNIRATFLPPQQSGCTLVAQGYNK